MELLVEFLGRLLEHIYDALPLPVQLIRHLLFKFFMATHDANVLILDLLFDSSYALFHFVLACTHVHFSFLSCSKIISFIHLSSGSTYIDIGCHISTGKHIK